MAGMAAIEITQPPDPTDPDNYHVTYSQHHQPIAMVKPGDTLSILTMDALGNRVTSESQSPGKLCPPRFGNPQTGPIIVEGAEPGDTLVAKIHDIEPTRDFAVTVINPRFGGLVATNFTRMINDPVPERVKLLPIHGGFVHFNDKIKIPYKPFMGPIGVAPPLEAISSLVPGDWGGNMDCVETGPGSEVHLPVRVEGAHFFTGDAHACQGDGEITGTAAEIPSRVTLTLDLIKSRTIDWPRIVNDDYIMTTGSVRPLDDAVRIACCELIDWLVADYGFEKFDAYCLLGQAMELRFGNMVDPNYTVVAKLARNYIE